MNEIGIRLAIFFQINNLLLDDISYQKVLFPKKIYLKKKTLISPTQHYLILH